MAIRASHLGRSAVLVPYDLLPTVSYYFPYLELHPYVPADSSAAILEKLESYGARGFLYAARPGDDLPERMKSVFRMEERELPVAPGATLYRINGRT